MEGRAELGRALAEIRKEKGLTQSQVAERVGETRAWVARNEAGTRGVDPVELARIARALGVGLVEILDRAKVDHRRSDDPGSAGNGR